jgi:hypothetical protein
MFMGYRQGAIVPFENNYGEKRVLVTDSGKIAVVGTLGDNGWWMQTVDDYDQGPAGVTMEALRARVVAVREAIASSGLPHDNITALAAAVAGLDSAGWDDFNAIDFHKGVAAISTYILADREAGTTTVYQADGTRKRDVAMEGPAKGGQQ